jgi:hypothetical protein
MKKYLALIFFSLILVSCGNVVHDNDNQIQNATESDPFRENVLTLRNAGLLKGISDKAMDSLIDIFRKDSLNGLKNLLVKSGELLQLNLNVNNKRTPLVAYKEICDAVGNKFPDLKNDSLTCNYIPDEPGGKDTGWIFMRQRIGNDVYSQRLYYFKDWQMDETFCKIYNKRLAAEKKDYRIYLITFMCTDCFNPLSDAKVKQDIRTMGIISLTKAQANVLMSMGELAIDPEDEFAAFSPAETDNKIKQFESAGILQKNDSVWWRVKRNEMRTSTIYGMEDMYNFLDTLFGTVSFDTMNEINPYEDVIRKMAIVSRGKFDPGAVTDETEDPTTHKVSFALKGKVYEMEAEQKNGILDPSVVDEVNKALEEQKIGGAFYTVLSRDNRMLVVYLDDKSAQKAKESGFFSEFSKGVSQQLKDRYAGPQVAM